MQNLQQFCWHSSLDLKILGVRFVLNSLFGRFFLLAPPNSNEYSNKLSTCKAICAELGVPLAEEKTLGPSTVTTFLRIELDSVKFEARLPVPKLVKAKSAVNKFLSLKSATKSQLLSLIGYLQHCCKVIAQALTVLTSSHWPVDDCTKFGSSHPYYEIG